MAYPDVTLKIHHIDGDMSAPWEYYDTPMKCEVGTPMNVRDAVVPYKFAAMANKNAGGSVAIKDLWISMGEYADGLSIEEIASGDEDAEIAALSKIKPIPMVYIRNDMVLESVTYDTSFLSGLRVVLNVVGEKLDRLSWVQEETGTSDTLPMFLVIDAQPMVEGQDLPQKLLLRYIG